MKIIVTHGGGAGTSVRRLYFSVWTPSEGTLWSRMIERIEQDKCQCQPSGVKAAVNRYNYFHGRSLMSERSAVSGSGLAGRAGGSTFV